MNMQAGPPPPARRSAARVAADDAKVGPASFENGAAVLGPEMALPPPPYDVALERRPMAVPKETEPRLGLRPADWRQTTSLLHESQSERRERGAARAALPGRRWWRGREPPVAAIATTWAALPNSTTDCHSRLESKDGGQVCRHRRTATRLRRITRGRHVFPWDSFSPHWSDSTTVAVVALPS